MPFFSWFIATYAQKKADTQAGLKLGNNSTIHPENQIEF